MHECAFAVVMALPFYLVLEVEFPGDGAIRTGEAKFPLVSCGSRWGG